MLTFYGVCNKPKKTTEHNKRISGITEMSGGYFCLRWDIHFRFTININAANSLDTGNRTNRIQNWLFYLRGGVYSDGLAPGAFG